MLAKPSWSVQSLLEPEDQRSPEASITPKQLHHLLRLSALPPPRSEEEEAKMISTLQSQLHFVRAIQNVDTTGIEPLQSIRDETEDAERENEITLESLRAEFDKEVVVGHSRRITRTPDASSTAESTDGWELLSQAPKKAGRYVVVETGKR
ncbi:hypothetical protein MMC20_004055 [Loxospora ochrophaea]|nr:hypothetical protein [Loxospora ochrophaea]